MELKPNEQVKYNIIKEYVSGKITRKQAAIKLAVSTKTISVLKAGYEQEGKAFFKHKGTGRIVVNKVLNEVEDSIVRCYEERYSGFNFSHFYELTTSTGELYELTYGEVLSARTIARILERHGVTSPQANKKRREVSSHPVRPRRLAFGELVQTDASIHDWLSLNTEKLSNGRAFNVALHLAVDDSNSSILAGYFAKEETLAGYYEIFRQILEGYGIPDTFYTDRRTVFWHKAGSTQFEQACQDLGVRIISTSVAQAKGRVERSFRTHQDRLVNELRASNITTIDAANAYLPEYIRRHNEKFALRPSDGLAHTEVAFRPLDKHTDIDRILSTRKLHKVLSGGIVSFSSNQYCIVKEDGSKLLLPVNTPVEVIKTLDERLLIAHNGIDYGTQFIATGRNTAHAPPLTHPWKQHYPR